MDYSLFGAAETEAASGPPRGPAVPVLFTAVDFPIQPGRVTGWM